MGVDKAWIGPAGGEMASCVAGTLVAAGCEDVVLVGGDRVRCTDAGWRWIPDLVPGAGPLGGIASATLRHRGSELMVAACDLPHLDAIDVEPLALELHDRGADVAVFEMQGRPQWSLVALSVTATATAVETFGSGERSLWRAFTSESLDVRRLEPRRPEAIRDADRPADLPERLRPPRHGV